MACDVAAPEAFGEWPWLSVGDRVKHRGQGKERSLSSPGATRTRGCQICGGGTRPTRENPGEGLSEERQDRGKSNRTRPEHTWDFQAAITKDNLLWPLERRVWLLPLTQHEHGFLSLLEAQGPKPQGKARGQREKNEASCSFRARTSGPAIPWFLSSQEREPLRAGVSQRCRSWPRCLRRVNHTVPMSSLSQPA